MSNGVSADKNSVIDSLISANPSYQDVDREILWEAISDKYPHIKEAGIDKNYDVFVDPIDASGPEVNVASVKIEEYDGDNFLGGNAINNSIWGKAYKIATGEEIYDLSREEGSSVENIVNTILQLSLDASTGVFKWGGELVSGPVRKGLENYVQKKLVTNGVEVSKAFRISRNSVKNYLSGESKGAMANQVLHSAGSFGAYDALHDVLDQKESDIDSTDTNPSLKFLVTPWGIDYKETGTQYLEGMGKGTFVAGGKIFSGLSAKYLNLPKSIPEFAGEGGGLLVGGRVIEGHPITAQSTLETYATIGGMKIGHKVIENRAKAIKDKMITDERLIDSYRKLLEIGVDKNMNAEILKKIKKVDGEYRISKEQRKELQRILNKKETTETDRPELESVDMKIILNESGTKIRNEIERVSSKNEVMETEWLLGLDTKIAQAARVANGIRSGNLNNTSTKRLINYQDFLMKNMSVTTRTKLLDTGMQMYALEKFGAKPINSITGLRLRERFLKAILPAPATLSYYGGAPGKLVSNFLYNHSMTRMFIVSEYGKTNQFLNGARGLDMSKSEKNILWSVRDKKLVKWDKLSDVEKEAYIEIHGRGKEGEPDYRPPNPESRYFKANKAVQETMDKYWDRYVELVLENNVGTKKSQTKLKKMLQERFEEDYLTHRLSDDARNAIISNRGGYRTSLKSDIFEQIKENNKKLPKDKRLTDDKISEIAEGMIMSFKDVESASLVHNTNFEHTRGIKLQRYRKIIENGKEIEIKTYDTSYEGFEIYANKTAKYLATMEHYPEQIGHLQNMIINAGGVPKKPSEVHLSLKHLSKGDRRLYDYAMEEVNNTVKGRQPDTIFSNPLRAASNFVAWTGLTSPFSGMKNHLLGDVANLTVGGVRGYMMSYAGLISPDAWKNARDGNATFMSSSLLGVEIGKWNPGLMHPTEIGNRVRAVSMGNYLFRSAINVLRKDGVSQFFRSDQDALHILRDYLKLSKQEIDLSMDYGWDINSKAVRDAGPEIAERLSNIKKKVITNSHANTQGLTSAPFLPKWARSEWGRAGTVFYRMAYRAGVNLQNNVIIPMVEGNILPALRHATGSGVSGALSWELKKYWMGRTPPNDITQIGDDWKQYFTYGYTAEFLGPLSNAADPRNNGLFDAYLPVVGDAVVNATELITSISTNNTRTAGQSLNDYLTSQLAIIRDANDIIKYRLQRKPEYIKYQEVKSVRKLLDTWESDRPGGDVREKQTNRWNYSEKSKMKKDLQEALWTGDEENMGKMYWSAVYHIADEKARTRVEQYTGDESNRYYLAFLDAKKEVDTTLEMSRPIDFSYDLRNGRYDASIKGLFMDWVAKADSTKYKQIMELESHWAKRYGMMRNAIDAVDVDSLYSFPEKTEEYLKWILKNPDIEKSPSLLEWSRGNKETNNEYDKFFIDRAKELNMTYDEYNTIVSDLSNLKLPEGATSINDLSEIQIDAWYHKTPRARSNYPLGPKDPEFRAQLNDSIKYALSRNLTE